MYIDNIENKGLFEIRALLGILKRSKQYAKILYMARNNNVLVAFSALEIDHIERAMIISRNTTRTEWIRKAIYSEINRTLGTEQEPNLLKPDGYKAANKKRKRLTHQELRNRIWQRDMNRE